MEYLGALLLIVLSSITLVAFFLAIAVLFPRRVGLSQQSAADMPGRSILLGLINTLFLAALIFGFIALADGTGAQFFSLLALGLLVVYLVGLAFGLTGLVQLVGTRMLPEAGVNRQRILGATTLILGCLTPFVGWFGLLVYLCLLGFGGIIISFFRRPPNGIPPDSS
jgi:hypothetical protein